MKFISTRNSALHKTLTAAICAGLAEDGGLFVPESFPTVNLAEFSPDLTYPLFAQKLLQPFFAEDALAPYLSDICANAFSFPVPLKQLTSDTFILELFHGPTLSFKDFGARFLAECLNRIVLSHPITILVATSGDTGSAVASAFYQKAQIKVVILYPKGQITPQQEQQITCWQNNILALAVNGSFDQCQKIVKTAFQDSWWQNTMNITSANSINIGRLLPQMTYYAYHSRQFFARHQTPINFIVPTGNLGNATAAYWAQAMGFPIGEIVLATNANQVIPDYLATGDYQPKASLCTLANAMDVGNPSNFERLQYLFTTFAQFKQHVSAVSVSDEHIQKAIQQMWQQHHTLICPHTATACFTRQTLTNKQWAIVATADPSKFAEVITPVTQQPVPIPPALQQLLERKTHFIEVGASDAEVKKCVQEYWQQR